MANRVPTRRIPALQRDGFGHPAPVSVNQAKEAIAAFDKEYPGIAAYAEATAEKDVIVTRLGRRRHDGRVAEYGDVVHSQLVGGH